jgi:hypothetical protein
MPPSTKAATDNDGLRPKWVPLRKDQYGDLTALARDLQDARTKKDERITENTLIRVAIDVILAHPELLAGNTEAELRSHALQCLASQAGGKSTAPDGK